MASDDGDVEPQDGIDRKFKLKEKLRKMLVSMSKNIENSSLAAAASTPS